jgi:TetR/AcrR family transcriptional regulator
MARTTTVRRSEPRSRNAEQTKQEILRAAIDEFAHETVAGARIDEIARAAGVNKALLYYYFHDKEQLYGAVLDYIFSELTSRVIPVLDSELPPGEKIRRYVDAYFDAVASVPQVPRILQQEIMRAGRDGSPHIKRIAQTYTRPLAMRVRSVLERGIDTGEFRRVDPQHTALSIVATVVFYFTSAPMLRAIFQYDPLAPARIAERKAAVLDFITHALFTSGHQASRRKVKRSLVLERRRA